MRQNVRHPVYKQNHKLFQKSRVVRPVTWTPEKEQSSESDDDIYEMEQVEHFCYNLLS